METIINPFTRTSKDYHRDIGIEDSYIEQSALFIHKSTGKDIEICRNFVREEIYGPESQMKDPVFRMLERDDELDQKPITITFSQYLKDLIENEWIMTPTFTAILPPHQKVSLLSEYIKGNLKKRKKEKDLMFEADRKGDEIRSTLHNNNQNNAKILNNAISGNHRSEHSPLYDRSTHPVLTSCCRIANGIANSNNDRLLSGNRHYHKPHIVIANITSILELTDWTYLKNTIKRYNLHLPTVEETLDVLDRSCSLYWRDVKKKSSIVRLIKNCTPEERAAIVYTGDLYHLREYNQELIRDFIKGLVTRATHDDVVEDPKKWLNFVDEDTIAQVKIMFPEILGEEDIWHPKVEQHPDYALLGTQCKLIYSHLSKYAGIINSFFMSRNIPFLISDFPHAIRRAGVGSDTDSAIFTVQDWVNWYSGNDDITYENIVIAESLAFIISETTTHNLASMTKNMGVVEEKEVFRLSMKNEFLFPIFVLTTRAKNYFANQAVKEGVLFKEYKREKKGVELIASNSPAGVRSDLDTLINDILKRASESKKIEVGKYLRWVARWEYTIYDSIVRGETTYLKAARVKEEDGYEGENSPYLNYSLWQEVFAPRYGATEPPPYSALAFSIVHDSKKKTERWLSSWKDQEMAVRMGKWLEKNNKKFVGRMLLPESQIMTIGIPEDILGATNIRKIIGSAVSPFYLVLESLDYFLFDKNQTKLVFDMVTREEAFSDFNEVDSALRPKEPVVFLED